MNNSLFLTEFFATVSHFIGQLSAHPDWAFFIRALLVTLVVIVFFTEVAKFMLTGLDVPSIVQSSLMVIATLLLWVNYDTVFSISHAFFDEVGLTILDVGTGNRDGFFLSKYFFHALNQIYVEDLSIFQMTMASMVMAILWELTTSILHLLMWLVGAWGVLLVAMAKMIGPLFVPLLAHPATRPFFDGWFRFTLGALMLLILLRAAGVIAALAFKAQLTVSKLLDCGSSLDFSGCRQDNPTLSAVPLEDANIGISDMLIMMVLCMILILSVLGITKELVGGVASPSKALNRGAGQMAAKLATKLMGSPV
ncbi:type IV secretion system protein [Vibrio maritimus]|uniref:type IV secretion system protein n=1 Tax=Vibrio maritimus TaxID=990268 RepID=UPI001F47DD1F|nr:hypothetical protein [Vibrio maritimus]